MISLHEKSEKWMYTFYLADVLLSISILEKNKFLQRVKQPTISGKPMQDS